tara:strand:- start:681 stop:821 length:141 start_codon:yes stop_codon:yes gene_type:complete
MDYEVQDISGEILSEKKNEPEPRKKKPLKWILVFVCFRIYKNFVVY